MPIFHKFVTVQPTPAGVKNHDNLMERINSRLSYFYLEISNVFVTFAVSF